MDALWFDDAEYSYEGIGYESESDDLCQVQVYPRAEEVASPVEELTKEEYNRKYPHSHISDEALWEMYLGLDTVEEEYGQKSRK